MLSNPVSAFGYEITNNHTFGVWNSAGSDLSHLNQSRYMSSNGNIIASADWGNHRILFINQSNFELLMALYILLLPNGTEISIQRPESIALGSNNSVYYCDYAYKTIFYLTTNGTVLNFLKGNFSSIVYLNDHVFILTSGTGSDLKIFYTNSNLQNPVTFINSTEQDKLFYLQAITKTSMNSFGVFYGELTKINNQWTNTTCYAQIYAANNFSTILLERTINILVNDNVTHSWNPLNVFSFDIYDNNTLIVPGLDYVYIFSFTGTLIDVIKQLPNNQRLLEPVAVIVDQKTHYIYILDQHSNVLVTFLFTDLTPETFTTSIPTTSSFYQPFIPPETIVALLFLFIILCILLISGAVFIVIYRWGKHYQFSKKIKTVKNTNHTKKKPDPKQVFNLGNFHIDNYLTDIEQLAIETYHAPDYETAIKIQQGGFPDYETYKKAMDNGINTYNDWLKMNKSN